MYCCFRKAALKYGDRDGFGGMKNEKKVPVCMWNLVLVVTRVEEERGDGGDGDRGEVL